MMTASLLEVVSVASVLPFIASLTDNYVNINQSVFFSKIIQKISGFDNSKEIIIVSFFALVLISGFVKLITNLLIIKIANQIGGEITKRLFTNIINSHYEKVIGKNTAQFQATLNAKIDASVTTVIVPMLGMINATFVLILLMTTLIAIEPVITVLICAFFSIVYLMLTNQTKLILSRNGQNIATLIVEKIRIINESIMGLKDVVINNLYHESANKFNLIETSLRDAHTSNHQIAILPRTIIEIMSMLILGLIVLYFWKYADLNNAFPTLALLVLAVQRIVPQFNQIYAGLSSINGFIPQINDIMRIFDSFSPEIQKSEHKLIVQFKYAIELNNINLKYNGKLLLSNLNARINKGDWIGIIGESGVGKTSLLDLIISLRHPSGGYLSVDGVLIDDNNSRAWQKNISYVSQNIFLVDGSIAENIALGIEKRFVDIDKLNLVVELADLKNFAQQKEDGLNYNVGENGSNLSGGQKQRIAIARALYKEANLIILDEATSALDTVTENKILCALSSISRNVTIIMVSHNRDAIQKYSTKIWSIENKSIEEKNITETA